MRFNLLLSVTISVVVAATPLFAQKDNDIGNSALNASQRSYQQAPGNQSNTSF